ESHEALASKHPSVGAVRSIGLFGAIELVRNRATKEPLDARAPGMASFMAFLRREGLYTMNRSHTFFTNPPLCVNEEELAEGFRIIDRGLDLVDRDVA